MLERVEAIEDVGALQDLDENMKVVKEEADLRWRVACPITTLPLGQFNNDEVFIELHLLEVSA